MSNTRILQHSKCCLTAVTTTHYATSVWQMTPYELFAATLCGSLLDRDTVNILCNLDYAKKSTFHP